MEYKILEGIGIENENVDGAAFNNLSAGMKDGIVAKVLKECNMYISNDMTTITILQGLLVVQGFRVKILTPYTYTFNSFPADEYKYNIIASITLKANRTVSFNITVRQDGQAIQRDNLFANEVGTYECIVGSFIVNSTGIINLKKVIPTLTNESSNSQQLVQVQSNWNETDSSSPAYIKNKPPISTLIAGEDNIDEIFDNGFYLAPSSMRYGTMPSFVLSSGFWLEVESVGAGFTNAKHTITLGTKMATRHRYMVNPQTHEYGWTDWIEFDLEKLEEKPTLAVDTTTTAITLTPQANNVYQYGELATLTLDFATASLNDCFNISFKSGETPTELIFNLTADGTTLAVVKDFVPEANTYCEIAGRWNGYVWNIVCNQVAQ